MSDEEGAGLFFFQSPWRNIFLWHFMEVENEAFIATPCIDLDVLRKLQSILIARADRRLKIKLLVRFSEGDLIRTGSDPEVLRLLSLIMEEPNSRVSVRFATNLSLTTLVLDMKKAIMSTGDLSSEQLTNDITFGNLITDKDSVSELRNDLNKIWKKAYSAEKEEILDYMHKLKQRIDLKKEQIFHIDEEHSFNNFDIISLGNAVEPFGKDRKEPHLDEIRKIIKELLIRARDAVDMEKPEVALFYIEEGLSLDPENPGLQLEKGKILFEEQEEYEKAIECFDKVLNKNKEDRDAWAYRGMCYHELGELDEALQNYDQSTEIDPQYYPVWIKKGIIMGKTKGREEDGLKCLEYALSQDPYNEEAWFNKAQVLEQRLKRMDEAIMSYRSLLRINPKHIVGSFRMGLLSYKRLNDIKKAKKYFDRVIEADPSHVHAWLFKGEIADRIDGDFKAAFDCLENAREMNPDSPEVLRREIELLLDHRKKFKKALELSEELLLIKEKDPVALYVSGLGALKIDNDPELALKRMNESIRSDPKNKRTIISKANILAEYLNRAQDAVKLLKAAIKKNDEDPELWLELGLVYFDFLYDPAGSLKCFDMVTRLDKENSDGWYNKGMVLSRGFEKHQDGLKCLDQATKLDDDHFLAWHEKGRILHNAYEMLDDAARCYRKALSIEPNDPEILASMGHLLKARGDLPGAVVELQKAVESDPSNINMQIDLAEFHHEAKDHEQVHSVLTEALQLDPKNERIWMLKAETFQAQNELVKALECYKRVLRFDPDDQDALNKKTSVEAKLEKQS
ncbi:MAG: tetratricopeptide repeat protein [Thermoplasmatota archaeon]